MDELILSHIDQTVAVSKNRSLAEIKALYDLGFRMFGENRIQELLTKVDNDLPGIRWHMIGHLQTNKVPYAVRYCELIHSVDSLRLLEAIERECHKQGKIQDVLIQVNVAREETKFGISEDELFPLIRQAEDLSMIRIRGIMVIGPHTDDQKAVRDVFRRGQQLFEQGTKIVQSNVDWDTLSMGMTDDYPIALECGTTLMRIGRALFRQTTDTK